MFSLESITACLPELFCKEQKFNFVFCGNLFLSHSFPSILIGIGKRKGDKCLLLLYV